MKKLFSILFVLVLALSLGLVTAAPVLAGTIIYVPGDFPTIQEAVDAAGLGDTIRVAAGEYDAFLVLEKQNISIISTEGATVTTADWVSVDRGPIEDAWVMAVVKDSESICIDGISFDGSAITGKQAVVGIAYIDSTGRIADLTVENIFGAEIGAGVAIIGDADTPVVNLLGVTLKNSMAGVIIWDAEASLDGCTITGMEPNGGFGIMSTGAGIVIGIPGEEWGPSTVTVKGSTVSNNNDIGIYVCDDSIVEAHFNNIVGNVLFGVLNDGGESLDAAYNWWGHASGPFHPTANPGGSGNAVSDDVIFQPWVGVRVVTETVTDDTVDATEEADTEVTVTGTATVTVTNYASNPGGAAPAGFISLGKYIDVYVPDTSQVTEIEIRLYYTADDIGDISETLEESLRLRWWNGTAWAECSDGGVNTASTGVYSGYMWARMTADTEPSLADLQGMPVDGGIESSSNIPDCGCFIATAAYGTDTAQELNILREFRDTVLLPNSLGAKFVSLYYRTSPPIASLISRHEVVRTAVRVGLVDPIVKILSRTYDLWSNRGS